MIIASFVGTLGADAELRTIPSGQTVCSFRLASGSRKGDQGATVWVRASIWGNRGEKLSQYLTKGKRVFVSGELSLKEYEGKTYLELNVDHLDFAERKRSDNGEYFS